MMKETLELVGRYGDSLFIAGLLCTGLAYEML